MGQGKRLLLGLALLTAASPAWAAPPNILIILADDLGYGDPGCYNRASKIPTPNIDRLASQGMRFTDAHTPSAVCTPTRYGILTGRYCWRTSLKRGVLDGYSPLLIEPGRLTLPSLLKQHGYATACVGKWHLGLGDARRTDYARPLRPGPNVVGFDYFFGIPASLDMPPYVFVENDAVTEAPTATIAASAMRRYGGKGFWRAGAIAPGFRHQDVLPRLADKAVEVVRKQTRAKPFFLYLALSAPHTPWLPTDDFRGKSGAGPYGDFVAQVDAVAGRVVRALDDAGLADNTLVVFTSDNGAHWLPEDIRKWRHRANDDLRGQKADIWDGGHRVPFIARWPGKVRPGSTSRELACLTDFMATAADIVGAKLPEGTGEDSFSILPPPAGREARPAGPRGRRPPLRRRHLRHPPEAVEAGPGAGLPRLQPTPGREARAGRAAGAAIQPGRRPRGAAQPLAAAAGGRAAPDGPAGEVPEGGAQPLTNAPGDQAGALGVPGP